MARMEYFWFVIRAISLPEVTSLGDTNVYLEPDSITAFDDEAGLKDVSTSPAFTCAAMSCLWVRWSRMGYKEMKSMLKTPATIASQVT